MDVSVTLKLRNRILPILVGVLLILTAIDSYPGWRMLLVGVGGTWLVSYLWARSLADNVRLKREIRYGWTQVGDLLEERYTLANTSWIPCLWCQVKDYSDIPGYNSDRVTAVGGLSSNHWRTRGVCTTRGLFNLGPTSILMADPFHFYSVEVEDLRSLSLMVTPPVVPLPQIDVAPGGKAGQGRPRSNAPERTVSAAGVREYLAGDSLRWIHWPTSARKGELFVRLFDSTPAADWWIILDFDRNVQVGEDQDSTAEHAVVLAASLADRGLRIGRAVGLVAQGKELIWLPPREGDGQRWSILRSLALLSTSNQPLSRLIASTRPTFGKFTSLVIITPDVIGTWIEELLPLMWGGAVPTVLLLDPQKFGGKGNPNPLVNELNRWGIYNSLITPELLNRPEARPGTRGHWEWKFSPTGRAILASKPRDLGWKALS